MRRRESRWENFKLFWSVFGPSPGAITAILICEFIFWTSPQWAQDIHFPTHEGQMRRAVASCEELIDREVADRTLVVHDDRPVTALELDDWTPQRVEAVYDSGLTVVSTLGPHGNLQTLVRDLSLPVGTTFRIMNGEIVDIS